MPGELLFAQPHLDLYDLFVPAELRIRGRIRIRIAKSLYLDQDMESGLKKDWILMWS